MAGAKPTRPSPPYQLVKGDRYNLTIGVIAAFFLACLKDTTLLPKVVSWQLNAYTNWNLAFCALRVALQQSQWDPFLLTNSLGVFLGFRTAFCQGLDENLRHKFKQRGLELPRPAFVIADHLCHTLPPLVLLAALIKRKQRVPYMNSVYVSVLATWFSFRQNARLDASDLYVPHPWKRAWAGIFTGVLTTPLLVDALIDRRRGRAALCALALLAPWLSAKLDPELRQKYNFECKLASAKTAQQEQLEAERIQKALAGRKAAKGADGKSVLPRSQSEVPLKIISAYPVSEDVSAAAPSSEQAASEAAA